MEIQKPNYPDNTQQCLKIGHCSCAQTWLLSYLKPILCQAEAEIQKKNHDRPEADFIPLTKPTEWWGDKKNWCSNKAVTCAPSLKCVISACLLVDKECECVHVSSTRPPGVHTQPRQSSDSSYSEHVGRFGMTHSDDSRTSIMWRKKKALAVVKLNLTKNDWKNRRASKVTHQMLLKEYWLSIL